MATLKSRVGAVVIPLLPVNRRTFDILRHELHAISRRLRNAISLRFRRKVKALRGAQDLSVNIGSGGKGLAGWVNIELAYAGDTTLALDFRQPLPLADGSVARLLAEHVVEHVDFRGDVPGMFADWHRVLKAGGVARIIVPDGKRFAEAYVGNDPVLWKGLGWHPLPEDILTPMHALNHIFHQGGEHLFAYDFQTLELALKQAGFSAVHHMAYQQSIDPQLAIDQQEHAAYSLYVDAVK